MRKQILYYAIKYRGEWNKIAQAIERDEAWESVSYDGLYITIYDEDYPERLRTLRYAPWILFYEGDPTLLQKDGVAIVGSRNNDAFGKQMCEHIVELLKHRYVIISGMAKGIDAIAHQSALDCNTIGVIGCGLDVYYPKENTALYAKMRKQQLLVSEYPIGTKPLAFHFPWRNRILAALGSAVVVVQARKRSGTLLSVNEALDLDIPVYCVPHAFGDGQGEGCNLLISQGAQMLIDDIDICAI